MPSPILTRTISTSRLLLAARVRRDVDQLFPIIEAERDRLGEHLPWVAHTTTITEARAYAERISDQWREGQLFDYSITVRDGESVIGCIGVHSVAWAHRRCELGYWVSANAEGSGYIREACAALERECFGAGFQRIEIRCSPDNVKSAKVARALGYTLEGTLRQDFVLNGVVRDSWVFGKLSTDQFNPINPRAL